MSRVRGVGRDRRRQRRSTVEALPRAARQRPGAVRRARRRLLHRGQRAVRRGRGDVAVRPSRRRTRRRDRRPRRRSGRRPRRHPAAGVRRCRAPGHRLPTSSTAEVTTRDINRGDAPHFLLKEITEAPLSFAKTLRGKIVERDGRLGADVGERALPRDVVDRLGRRNDHAGACDRPGHRGRRRPEHRSDPRRAHRRPAGRRRHHGHRAVGLRDASRHVRHAGDRCQPVRHHDRHQPHGRSAAGRVARR